MSRRSPAVSLTTSRFSLQTLDPLRAGIGTIPRFLRQQPRERHLPQASLSCGRRFWREFNDSLIRLPVLRCKARGPCYEVAPVERRGLVDLSREEPFPTG